MKTSFYISFFLFCFGFHAGVSYGEVCWKGSYGRGVGSIPAECGDFDKSGLLCYPKCRDGYKGVAFVCWQNCPTGFTDTGAHCLKPKPYGRGTGYAIWNEKKCNNEHRGKGCEKCLAMWYPKCNPGFHAVGCNICSPDCPAGSKDIGVSCQKDSYTRKTVAPNCGDKQYNAGLCYKTCSKDYKGIGPLCWGQCPPDMPVDCGAMCGKSQSECIASIAEQVLSVGEVVAKVAAIVATAGAAAGGEVAAEAAEESAVVSLKTTVKELAKKFVKGTAKQIKENLIEELMKQPGMTSSTAEGLASMAQDPEGFDYKSFLKGLDPTGLLKVVDAFNKKICTAK